MNESSKACLPVVSVILPVRNESPFIEKAVTSLLQQETPDCEIELLVIDGMSTDDSADKVRALSEDDPRIRLLINEEMRTPFAFNMGLREASGEYVCILGAHNTYARDYIATCLRELLAHDAVGCSGRTISKPAGENLGACLSCWTMGHPIGTSPRSFRTQPEGFMDTIPYAVIRKQALLEVGGYDENLLRNQDNDMNQKLVARGHKLYCTWKTHCEYHTPATLNGLAKYAFRNGYWNVISLRRNRASMKSRHLIPGVFVLVLLLAMILAIAGMFVPKACQPWLLIPLASLLAVHLCVGVAAAFQVAIRERSLTALMLPVVFLLFHTAYGAGSVYALLSGARCNNNAKSRET